MPGGAPVTRTAATQSLDVAYDTMGSGPPLVLLHAGVTDRHLWDAMAPALADHFTLLIPDLRGFGETRVTNPGPWSLHGDLGEFLDAVSIDQAHLCGVSMGGGAALNATLFAPQRTERLVLINPALYGYRVADTDTLAAWEEIDGAVESGDHDEAATLEAAMWLAGPDRSLDAMDPDVVAAMRAMLVASYTLDNGGPEEPPERTPADNLGEVRAPTLVVHGTHDIPAMGEIARRLVEGIPDVRLIEMDTAHLPPFEAPDELTRNLLDFLA